MRILTCIGIILACFCLSGCDGVDLKLSLPSLKMLSKFSTMTELKKKPVWQSPLLLQHNLVGRIWRPSDGRFVDQDVLVEDLVRSSFILLGEKHDNKHHHLLQARLIRELTEHGRRPAVVWEMIPEAKQEVLDIFHSKNSHDSKALGKALGWDVSGWPDWSMYQPVADAAMAEHLAMYGAALSKPAERALVQGWPSPEISKRRQSLSLHIPMSKEMKTRSLERLFKGHCELMPLETMDPFFNVQRARDAVFAEHMLTTGVRDGSVLIAGDGHVRKDIGVPQFLRRRQPGVRMTTVGFVEVKDNSPYPIDYGRLFSGTAIPFDYVWFTPRADNQDHCAELRKKWGKPKKSKIND